MNECWLGETTASLLFNFLACVATAALPCLWVLSSEWSSFTCSPALREKCVCVGWKVDIVSLSYMVLLRRKNSSWLGRMFFLSVHLPFLSFIHFFLSFFLSFFSSFVFSSFLSVIPSWLWSLCAEGISQEWR